MTAYEISAAMKKRFSDGRRYAVAEEVGLKTGGGCRRLDMIVMDCYWSNGFRIDGFEYKISVADLRRELEHPDKHVDFFDVLDYYTLVCPAEVVMPLYDVIPKKWGILIVNQDGSTRYKRKPLALADQKSDRTISRGFMASFVRAIQGHEVSAEERKAEYERGVKDGQDRANRTTAYMSERLKREAQKLEAYDQLMRRFELWRDDNIDEIMDEFEAFRKLNIDWVKNNIDATVKKLTELKEML